MPHMSYMSTSWRNNKTILLDEVMLFKKIQEHLHVAKGLNLKEKTSIQNIFSQTFFFFLLLFALCLGTMFRKILFTDRTLK